MTQGVSTLVTGIRPRRAAMRAMGITATTKAGTHRASPPFPQGRLKPHLMTHCVTCNYCECVCIGGDTCGVLETIGHLSTHLCFKCCESCMGKRLKGNNSLVLSLSAPLNAASSSLAIPELPQTSISARSFACSCCHPVSVLAFPLRISPSFVFNS